MRRLARLAGGSSSIDRSARVGLLFAVVALLAASAAVRGPAVPERATVMWPDPSVALAPVDASSDPPVQWYSPLLLSNHRPERLVVHLPCRVAPTSPVFATTAPQMTELDSRSPQWGRASASASVNRY